MWNLCRARHFAYSFMLPGTMMLLESSGRFAALAQERQHPAEHMELHERFYSSWYMPDEPNRSCCNKADCYPTQVKFEYGQWWAMRREDGKYIPIPWKKFEVNRNNPDGRNHLCAPAPSAHHPPNAVYCFALGGGI
jgi:hypothetical protein